MRANYSGVGVGVVLMFALSPVAGAAPSSPGTTPVADPVPERPIELGDSCNEVQEEECEELGGVTRQHGLLCLCDFYELASPRIINAQQGDVGIVPIDGAGSQPVTDVTRAIGQFHRHAVMFFRNGTRTRHNTMYVARDEDGDIHNDNHVDFLRPNTLRNGLPGAITQTVGETLDRERLSITGLILKPALVDGTEPDRPRFIAALNRARATEAYYKLSDYTQQVSMSLPYNDSRSGDLRGSHCSGFIADAFRKQGFDLPDVDYPAAIRLDAAHALHRGVRSSCAADPLAIFTSMTVAPWMCGMVANQVTNCFAGRGCARTGSNWTTQIGVGEATSPDNLLATTFVSAGDEAYRWSTSTLPGGNVGVPHPGTRTSGPGRATSANTTSPFARVEAQLWSGNYMRLVRTITL